MDFLLGKKGLKNNNGNIKLKYIDCEYSSKIRDND